MSKAIVILFFLIVVGVAVYVLYLSPPVNANFGTVTIGSKDFHVEIADTFAKRQQGLSGRSSIGSDGMLFRFDTAGIYPFWMKDMKFPLDLIWINGSAVVEVASSIQPPRQGDDPARISPSSAANYVLEVPAGFVNQYLIEVGTRVKIDLQK